MAQTIASKSAAYQRRDAIARQRGSVADAYQWQR